MSRKSLSDWLGWQESLNVNEIELGLERVHAVAARLELSPPVGKIFTVAGTNGKGSCACAIEALLMANGYRTGLYTSPHLVRYNERVRVHGEAVDDRILTDAFERIEAVRGDIPLTFFEYGTLAALLVFSSADCEAWVLEVGLGGRLDAVNIIDADVAVITTVDLDHQDWLGDTIEQIALEKAGIMRPAKPVFYGDHDVPASIKTFARDTGALLGCLGGAYTVTGLQNVWNWVGAGTRIEALNWPRGAREVQSRNQGLALAACEASDPALVADHQLVRETLATLSLPGRLQVHRDRHEWVLDVAHNSQAAVSLVAALKQMDPLPTRVVIGMMADKAIEAFAAEFGADVSEWITCDVETGRGSSAEESAERLRRLVGQPVEVAGSVQDALKLAQDKSPDGTRVVVCGSFYVVGPALEWLGLY